MSEITIMGCDGCQKAATARRPVKRLSDVSLGDDLILSAIDLHDMECLRRFLSRVNKERREAAKAERQAKDSPSRGRSRGG